MAKRKPQTYYFKTVADMHAVPLEKLDWFCEDLRLWLTLHRMADAQKLTITTARDVFGWKDDNCHNARLIVTVKK